MLKIILIILGFIFFCFFIAVSYANGLVRGFKLMSKKNVETSSFEKKLIKNMFQSNEEINPYYQSLYAKEEIEKKTDSIKTKIKSKAIEKVKKSTKNKKSNGAKK